MPHIIKQWNVAKFGWEQYDREVVQLSKGRSDVVIHCPRPGILMLVQKEHKGDVKN